MTLLLFKLGITVVQMLLTNKAIVDSNYAPGAATWYTRPNTLCENMTSSTKKKHITYCNLISVGPSHGNR